MSAADDLSGMDVVARGGSAAAAYVRTIIEPLIDATIEQATSAERDDLLAYLARRIANAAAIERSTAPNADTREIAGDRRRQLEVIRDEISQGLHTGAAAVAAKLSEDAAAAVAAKLSEDAAAARSIGLGLRRETAA